MTSGPLQPSDEPAGQTTTAVAPDPGRPAVEPARSMGYGIVAAILGGLGCLLPLAPLIVTGTRAWISLPFALPGLIIGIMGCTGQRRGNVFAATGLVLCGIAVGLSTVMLISSSQTSAPKGSTQQILHDELDVRFSDRQVDPVTGDWSTTVTLYNKGSDIASYVVTIGETNGAADRGGPCESPVAADELAPGASHQEVIHSCESAKQVTSLGFQVTKATKNKN